MAAAPKKTGLPATLLLTALVGIPLLITPSVIRGLAANAWVLHYASLQTLPKPHKAAVRAVLEKTDLAIQNLAPLPLSSAAALRALELGERLEHQDHDSDAALLIYQGVRASCARVRERAFSGSGFAVIEARAAALENAILKSSPKAVTPK